MKNSKSDASAAWSPDDPSESHRACHPGGAIAITIFSATFLSTVFTFVLSIRTLMALPATLALATVWEYVSQQSVPSLASTTRLAGEYLQAAETGIGIFSVVVGVCSGPILGVETMFGGRKFRDLLFAEGGTKRFESCRALVIWTAEIAGMELGIGIAALRWWYGGSFDSVTRNWISAMGCGILGGTITAVLQWRRWGESKCRNDSEKNRLLVPVSINREAEAAGNRSLSFSGLA